MEECDFQKTCGRGFEGERRSIAQTQTFPAHPKASILERRAECDNSGLCRERRSCTKRVDAREPRLKRQSGGEDLLNPKRNEVTRNGWWREGRKRRG